MHKEVRPKTEFLLFISRIKVTSIRAPLAPKGCPKAMAPPFTFTLELSILNNLLTARDTIANASSIYL